MTKSIAAHQLRRTALCTWKGIEIWETQDERGYTGTYCVAPAGKRESCYTAKNVTKAFEVAARLWRERRKANGTTR